jgi:solute carrier family 13 (sodium-dependent dicarboxylate transporter), member 2/3/5
MMDWSDCKPISWGVALLLGAGFALASSFTSTNLSETVANVLLELADFPVFWFIVISCLFVSIMTEFMSNVAMANLVLPIVSSLAVSQGENPLAYMLPVTLACSFAFMLPAATPPNAIVFSYNAIKVRTATINQTLNNTLCYSLIGIRNGSDRIFPRYDLCYLIICLVVFHYASSVGC